jgi:hypothetical protein
VDAHILQNGPELNGIVDFGFLFAGEVDCFGITPPFDVENALVTPTMLVIPDEFAVLVGRQGGFASATEAEEESDIPFHPFIG